MGDFYLLIVGSRAKLNNKLYREFCNEVDNLISDKVEDGYRIIIVHGGCLDSADVLANKYAKDNGYKAKIFPAEWDKYNKAAGFKRNEEMHKYISQFDKRYVFAFWNGTSKGTTHSFDLAKKYNNPIEVYKFKK